MNEDGKNSKENDDELEKPMCGDTIEFVNEKTSSNGGEKSSSLSFSLSQPQSPLTIHKIINLNKGDVEANEQPRTQSMFGNRTYLVYFNFNRDQFHPPEDMPVMKYEPGRNKFVRGVMIIVLLMLLATAVFNVIVLNSKPMMNLFNSKIGLLLCLGAMLITFIQHCVIYYDTTRQGCCGIICLIITTVCMSIICAFLTSKARSNIVLGALVVTASVVAVCVVLALTSFDFTKFLLLVIVASLALSVAFLFLMVCRLMGYYIKPLHIGLLVISALISSMFLTIELQMVLGGKTVELGETEYVLGAIMIYTSIIDLFIDILMIMMLSDSD